MTRRAYDRKCPSCKIAMRPSKTLLADYPGTRCLGGDGLCSTCYRRQRDARQQAMHEELSHPVKPSLKDREAYIAAAWPVFHAYLLQRRALGVPAEGLPMELAAKRRGREAVNL